jgi:hypothetical protein
MCQKHTRERAVSLENGAGKTGYDMWKNETRHLSPVTKK